MTDDERAEYALGLAFAALVVFVVLSAGRTSGGTIPKEGTRGIGERDRAEPTPPEHPEGGAEATPEPVA